MVTTGATTGYDVPADLRQIFFKGINILGSTQGTRAELEEGFYWMGQGKIKVIIDSESVSYTHLTLPTNREV